MNEVGVASGKKPGTLASAFTIVVSILPAINVYSSPIPKLELGTFLIFVLFAFMVAKDGKIILDKAAKSWLLFLGICGICSIMSIVLLSLSSAMIGQIFFRFTKICVCIAVVLIAGKYYFDFNTAKKTIRFFSLAAIGFIVIQTILYYVFHITIFGVYLPWAEEQSYLTYDYARAYASLYRPSSFFLEPAHFSAYIIVYFTYLITTEDEPHRNIQLLIAILGILLSTSGSGMVLLAFVVMVSCVMKMTKWNGHFTATQIGYGIFLIGIAVIFLVIFYYSGIGQKAIGRMITSDGTLNRAVLGRLDSGALQLYKNLGWMEKLIGCGFGNRPLDVYFPSFYAILYGDGIVGVVALAYVIYIHYKAGNVFQRMLVMVYIVLMIGTGVFNFASIGFFFSLIQAKGCEPKWTGKRMR